MDSDSKGESNSSSDDLNTWLLSLQLDHRPVKRSVTIAGHATSISLEPAFWGRSAATGKRAECLIGERGRCRGSGPWDKRAAQRDPASSIRTG